MARDREEAARYIPHTCGDENEPVSPSRRHNIIWVDIHV